MELTVDGKRVYISTGGKSFDPGLPAIVFIHGAALDHTVWSLQTRYFAYHGRSVLAVDLPGHGASEGPPLEQITDLAQWIHRLLDAAGLEKAALVGHSLGATIVLEAAGEAPERIWALVLIGIGEPLIGAAGAPVNAELLAAAKANEHLGLDLINGWGHGRGAHVGGAKTPGLWMVGSGIRLLERAGPGVLYNDLATLGRYPSAFESAARIQCPVLFVLGDNDAMTPLSTVRKLTETIPGAQVVVLENSGHMMMAERPDEVLDALREVV